MLSHAELQRRAAEAMKFFSAHTGMKITMHTSFHPAENGKTLKVAMKKDARMVELGKSKTGVHVFEALAHLIIGLNVPDRTRIYEHLVRAQKAYPKIYFKRSWGNTELLRDECLVLAEKIIKTFKETSRAVVPGAGMVLPEQSERSEGQDSVIAT